VNESDSDRFSAQRVTFLFLARKFDRSGKTNQALLKPDIATVERLHGGCCSSLQRIAVYQVSSLTGLNHMLHKLDRTR
jgi:hypothetical protein